MYHQQRRVHKELSSFSFSKGSFWCLSISVSVWAQCCSWMLIRQENCLPSHLWHYRCYSSYCCKKGHIQKFALPELFPWIGARLLFPGKWALPMWEPQLSWGLRHPNCRSTCMRHTYSGRLLYCPIFRNKSWLTAIEDQCIKCDDKSSLLEILFPSPLFWSFFSLAFFHKILLTNI